jgi:hypothetical protein
MQLSETEINTLLNWARYVHNETEFNRDDRELLMRLTENLEESDRKHYRKSLGLTIQAAIDAVDNDYYYSMREFNDVIDHDEWMDRLESEKCFIKKRENSRFQAIRARRKELNTY